MWLDVYPTKCVRAAAKLSEFQWNRRHLWFKQNVSEKQREPFAIFA